MKKNPVIPIDPRMNRIKSGGDSFGAAIDKLIANGNRWKNSFPAEVNPTQDQMRRVINSRSEIYRKGERPNYSKVQLDDLPKQHVHKI